MAREWACPALESTDMSGNDNTSMDISSLGIVPVAHVWIVPLAIVLFAFSVFLLSQSVVFMRWVTRDVPLAPSPWAGLGLSVIVVPTEFIFFYVTWLQSSFPSISDAIDSTGADLRETGFFLLIALFPFRNPSAFSQALLVGSTFLGLMSMYKFIIAGALARQADPVSSPWRGSALFLVGAIVFNLLQLAGSFASIVGFFR
jgi:hypothetical protein